MMRIWLAIISLVMTLCLAHAAGEPLARIVVRTKQPVLVGQQVQVDVQVLAPNFFISAPQFPIFDMPGAIVTMPDETGTNFNETIDGISFAGIQKTYVITPRAAGDLTFPPASIAFQYADGSGKAADGTVTLPPVKIVVKLPEGADGAGGILPVAHIAITQSLDRETTGLKTGDALVRTVTITAEGMQAMMIPPPAFDAPEGVRIYRKDPILSDGVPSREGFKGGQRTEHLTYVFEKPGTYTLPAVKLNWLDPETNKAETAEASEIRLAIAAAPSFKPEIAPDLPPAEEAVPATRNWRPILTALGVVLVLTFAIYAFQGWLWPRFRAWLDAVRQARRESEPVYFRKVESAFAGRDNSAAYRALDAWTRRSGFRSIRAWALDTKDPQLQASLQDFQKAIFGGASEASGWTGASELQARIGAARKRVIAKRHKATDTKQALPPLNP